MKYILPVTALALSLVALHQGINRSERIECMQWQKEAGEYREYYLTSWQAEQCAAHGIEVEAPVK